LYEIAACFPTGIQSIPCSSGGYQVIFLHKITPEKEEERKVLLARCYLAAMGDLSICPWSQTRAAEKP